VPFGPSVVKHGSSFFDAHPTGVAGRGHESAPAEKHGGSKGDELGHSDVSATTSTRAKVTANAAAKAEEEAYHKKLVHAMTMMLRNQCVCVRTRVPCESVTVCVCARVRPSVRPSVRPCKCLHLCLCMRLDCMTVRACDRARVCVHMSARAPRARACVWHAANQRSRR
jgi:hypothetical protein